MKRYAIALAALALAYAATASADTRTYFGFQIGVGNAPPPPRVVYRSRPPMYFEPETRVYVVQNGYDDYDTFSYGGYYYVCEDDYWYRARSYRGPFLAVDVRSVPRPIFMVPQRRWRHYPQGLARWNYEQRGNGHGRGNGRWKDNHDNGKHGRGNDGWNNGRDRRDHGDD